MSDAKLISVIIPVYNEEQNIPLLHEQLKSVLARCQCSHEIIFVDDGSADNSLSELRKIASLDSSVVIIEFTRNFGKECATTAGLQAAKGDACIIIDADLQHPVELIQEFIKKWEQGAEVVVGVRAKNKGEGLIKRAGSHFFYLIMDAISETHLAPRSTDYRLLDRQVVEAFNSFTERNRMTRGLIAWLGFKADYVYFIANERKYGRVGYNPIKLTKLALSTFVSHSLFPLKLAGYLGAVITFFSGLLGVFIFIERYILKDPWHFFFSGPAILAVLNLFMIGIVLSCLGLVALYIAQIHDEVINRPLYVIRKTPALNR